MDYPYAKFADCTFSRFSFIVRKKADIITDAANRFTPATTIDVSKDLSVFLSARYILFCVEIVINLV